MKNTVGKKTSAYQDIYENMIKNEEYENILGTLTLMQTEQGVKLEDAKVNAELTVRAVCACESIRWEISEDTRGFVETMLKDIEKQPKREQMLHKLYFGLTAHRDADAEAIINGEMNVEDRFWRYYNENKDTRTALELEEGIWEALESYNLSADVLKALTRKYDRSDKYLATAAALGEGGMNLKCIAAMEMYLNNGGLLTIPEAANMACGAVEMQAAADAVGKGLMDRETAKKILTVAGIVLAVVALGFLVYHSGQIGILTKAAAEVSPTIMELSEVFAPFADAFIDGKPVNILVTAAEKVEQYYAPLLAAEKQKRLISGIVMTVGVAIVGISGKAADLIGKIRVGMAEKNTKATEGLKDMAQQEAGQKIGQEKAQTRAAQPEQAPVFQTQKERQPFGAV